MKEKIVGLMGGFGFVIYLCITSVLTFIPLAIVHWNFVIDAILIAIVLFVPIVGSVVQFLLWIISVPLVISGPFDFVAVLYYLALVIYLIAYGIPSAKAAIRFISAKSGRNTPVKMQKSLEVKPMFKYKILEPFEIVSIGDITDNFGLTNYGTCRLILETENYRFYGFCPTLLRFASSEYILREEKGSANSLVYFGTSADFICAFSGCLFLADRYMMSTHSLLCRDIETGAEERYAWFDLPGGFKGHFIDHDEISEIYIDGNAMIIHVKRAKCNFRNDVEYYESEYTLRVKKVGNKFEALRSE